MELSLKLPSDRECYGLAILKQAPNQLQRELCAYGMTRGFYGQDWCRQRGIVVENTGLKSATQHMINAMQIIWPNEVIFQSRGHVNTNIIELLECLNTYDDLGIAGHASSGKTWGMAAWALCDWYAAPHITSTWVASTTIGSSADRLWGSVESLHLAAKRTLEKKWGGSIGHLVAYKHMICFTQPNEKDPTRTEQNAIKAIAFESGNEGEKAVEETRGRKNERVRMLIDELAEMEPLVLNTRANLNSNDDFVFVGTANPSNKALNPHKDLCEPAESLGGWDGVNKEMHTWPTRTGHCLFLSGERNPNLKVPESEPTLFRGILSWRGLQKILKSCLGNTKSHDYYRNAVGYWPDSSIELTIFSKAFIKLAEINYTPEWRGATRTVAALDSAFTSGGDRNAVTFIRVGDDDTGRTTGQYLSTKQYHAGIDEDYETSIARQVVADCIKADVAPTDFGLDISGDGGKMLKAIIKEWMETDARAIDIYPISSMGNPTDRIVSSEDPRKCSDAFDRLVTEYWFTLRNAIQARVIVGLDTLVHSELVDELCTRLYLHKGKKISIETKKELKKRIRRSCDLADSLVYGSIMAMRAGVEIITAEDAKPLIEREVDAWNKRMSREDMEGEDEQDMFSYSGSSQDQDGF